MINKTQFIKEVAKKGNLKECEAERYVNLFLDTLKYSIKEYGGVKFVGLGKFVLKECKERIGRNPKNGNAAIIPKHKTVKFYVGEMFKDSLNV